ncbi:MAG: hypothetical protein JAY99_08250 [Candidatus Thiodiazotropha lotti]|uniref:Uncharacterized protein n=1 Tax=Candidatus Thiodiazotropha endoloripes TaxID=1818881 RepID=A0A1E2USQ6_9GAMM|nr:hypothetical protein [Candidatus Thiodiazotropha lotti]MCW4191270.1 hypothetical protein [Candidatus Thiodiazotropha weberae]ODB85720.1 hypothetical protein A3194_12900 [Candidatus Thiodiazotropha endoloripes]ODB86642.1 hypothetical protein A3195_13690 [Candidatus Thiodiazotropha endoloripes]ODB88673.1 hypothetical protein A3193_07485 [Candidatus Thiodiazotropha endoloripes]
MWVVKFVGILFDADNLGNWLTLLDFLVVANEYPELHMIVYSWLEEQACNGRPCKVLGWYPVSGCAFHALFSI